MKPSLTVKPKLLVVAIALTLNSGSLWAACTLGTNNDMSCTAEADGNTFFESTAGAEYRGINATTVSDGGNAELIFNNSTINQPTADGNSHGLNVRSTSGDATVLLKGNNNITLDNSAADTAIIAGAGKNAAITIEQGSQLNILVNNGNSVSRDGIEAWGENTSVQHLGSGTIETYGGHAIWVSARIAGSILVSDTNTQLKTHGNATYGLYGFGVGSAGADIDISNAATISTEGDSAHAIYGKSPSGQINIVNTGTLTTYGTASKGILAESSGAGKIVITNSGDITTKSQALKGTNTSNPYLAHAIFANNTYVGASDGITVNHSNGTITTSAYDATALRVESVATSGNLNVSSTNANLIVNGNNSDGILVSHNSGNNITDADINVTTTGGKIVVLGNPTDSGSSANFGIATQFLGASSGNINIIVDNTEISTGVGLDGNGRSSNDIYASISQSGTGNIDIQNSGKLSTAGESSYNIQAINLGSGDIEVVNQGELTTTGKTAYSIYATANAGNVLVNNSGSITTSGLRGYGINAQSIDGDVTVMNTGNINLIDSGDAIYARSENGDVSVFASGNITTHDGTSLNTLYFGNQGIQASALNGNTKVSFDNGTMTIIGNGDGIRSWDEYMGTGVNTGANVNVGPMATIDASQGLAGISVIHNTRGDISIAAGAVVHGGDRSNDHMVTQLDMYQVSGIRFSGVGTPDFVLNNAGIIDSMNDVVLSSTPSTLIDPNAILSGTLLVNNTGTMTGYMILSDEDTTFNNVSSNSFNLRNFTDADNDRVRDTKSVAISDFGGGNDVFNNQTSGSLRLSAVNTELHTDTRGEYLVDGAQSIANKGIVQGQLINLNRFVNSGLIDLTENKQAGDVLVISGASAAGTYGSGQYVSNGGTLALDTVLNEGGVNSLSDVLVLDDAVTGTSATKLMINRVSGDGVLTQGSGIKLIEVLGTSDNDAFVLNGPVKAGRYEYVLNQGVADQNWYLSNVEPPVITPPVIPTDPQPEEDLKPIYNPDIGSYLANQTAATQMFMHTLHDRVGEPQYTEGLKQEGRVPSVWLRLVANHTKGKAANGYFDQRANGSIIHLGGELAQWSNSGDNRFHMGIMGAYGKTESHTTGSYTKTRSNGKVDGYGAGAYLTWFENESLPTGAYVDAWSMYGWFNNEVDGSNKYDSNTWTNSVEAGYASIVTEGDRFQWMIEPQAQIVYTHYSADNHRDANGLSVSGNDASGINTRLGARTYMRNKVDNNSAQPFIEVNWLYGDAKNSLDFNGQKMSDDAPKNKLETKFGLQGQVTDGLQVYSHIGLQWGKDSYERSEAQIGVKYSF
ncbi:autotransporter outer membrane beta-barrel domain-containing protein [Budvicia aquatica]|uniref:Autotransporter outer membrane beta-barrel domain-containing protein n=1 Tax=Budvicia aquatica TaxID=82979 RepID=A0A2C6CPX2_9GAMM|nr:autotransporter outer membrane beta-barrel domain-containing protein [Budvicia aquatica]PHI28709.1 autotransporter outer membrane beta-barrel domain-containing protein [Budvicia aquatica]VFS46751.1 Outer membrane protein IcsA autotransporter precursor [Budvicia aquatica]